MIRCSFEPGNGTRYRLWYTDKADDVDSMLLALPDLHWSAEIGRFGPPPAAGWLQEHGLRRPDAQALAAWIASPGRWAAMTFRQDETGFIPIRGAR